jgi:acetyl esterase/lipase
MAKKPNKIPFYHKPVFFWILGITLSGLLLVALAFRVSPWPGALVVRTVFDRNAHKTLQGLEKDIPSQPVTVLSNQQYTKRDGNPALDVYIPNALLQTKEVRPVIIWTHGGAWLSGDKTDAAPYYKLLASQGYVVIALNYALAPEHSYPVPQRQINDVYGYIQANAARFHADTNKIVLAGDSAGSQLSSQMAAMVTNPAYAKEVGIEPKLQASQLAATVLYCGIYKMEGLTEVEPNIPKIVSWGSDVSVWAYLGTRDKSSPLVRQASPYYHVTKDFPTTFISGGNGDSLTNAQSVPLANELTALGASVTTLFYPASHTPSLPHEYQFTYDADGQAAFKQMTQFLQTVVPTKG